MGRLSKDGFVPCVLKGCLQKITKNCPLPPCPNCLNPLPLVFATKSSHIRNLHLKTPSRLSALDCRQTSLPPICGLLLWTVHYVNSLWRCSAGIKISFKTDLFKLIEYRLVISYWLVGSVISQIINDKFLLKVRAVNMMFFVLISS